MSDDDTVLNSISSPLEMTLSTQGYLEIGSYEGVCLRPYNDGTGVITIGFGSTSSDIPDLAKWDLAKYITLNEAVQYFKDGLSKYIATVNQHLTTYIYQYQFDALVSICYNIGQHGFDHSTFLKEINSKDNLNDIKQAILLWNKPTMITGRRTKEADLYVTGTYSNNGYIEYEDTDGKGHQLRSTLQEITVQF